MKRILLGILLFTFIGTRMIWAQEPTEGEAIIELIRTSNSKELSRKFNASVQLTLPDNDGRFNRTQAEIILRDFFLKYPSRSVNLNHQGSSNDGSIYAIGSYKTSGANYRVYVLSKKIGEVYLIHQLRIELDD